MQTICTSLQTDNHATRQHTRKLAHNVCILTKMNKPAGLILFCQRAAFFLQIFTVSLNVFHHQVLACKFIVIGKVIDHSDYKAHKLLMHRLATTAGCHFRFPHRLITKSHIHSNHIVQSTGCLLYTSDAADE